LGNPGSIFSSVEVLGVDLDGKSNFKVPIRSASLGFKKPLASGKGRVSSGTAYDLVDIVARSDIDARQIRELFKIALGAASKEDFINRANNSHTIFVGDEDLKAVADEIFSRACAVRSAKKTIQSGFEDDVYDNMGEDYPVDEEPVEPEEGDIVVDESRGIYEVGGRWSEDFEDWDQAARVVKEKMERDQYWPNIWQADDHGGYTLTSVDSSVYRNTVRT
jgi:hypothetical protein